MPTPWACGDAFHMAMKMAPKIGETNYLLTGMILQVAAKDKDLFFFLKSAGALKISIIGWVPLLIIGILYMLNYVEIIPCIFCEKKQYPYHPGSSRVDHLFTLGVQSPKLRMVSWNLNTSCVSGGDWNHQSLSYNMTAGCLGSVFFWKRLHFCRSAKNFTNMVLAPDGPRIPYQL